MDNGHRPGRGVRAGVNLHVTLMYSPSILPMLSFVSS